MAALVPRAALQAAECLAMDQRAEEAERAFMALSVAYSNRVEAAEGMLRVGKLREVRGDVKGAVVAYDAVIASSTNRLVQSEALLWKKCYQLNRKCPQNWLRKRGNESGYPLVIRSQGQ